MATKAMSQRRGSVRGRVLGALFGMLYRNRYRYWFASTVPFAGQWRVWQRLTLPRIRGPRVLEIGCGPGKLLAPTVTRITRPRLAVQQLPQPAKAVWVARCGAAELFVACCAATTAPRPAP